jgi:uncharacterized membrane-anchored protein
MRNITIALLLSLSTLAVAANDTKKAAPPPAQPVENMPWQAGPTKISLGHEIDLALPENYVFLGMPHADKLLRKFGSFHNEGLLGVVAAKDEKEDWFVVIDYDESGYVKDDEKIDADDLIKSFREGVKEMNPEREKQGFPGLVIDGWAELPRYEKAAHHVVWGILVSNTKNPNQSVNFNTRILGRRGYVSLNLVTDPKQLATYKERATTLLASTTFREGSRYENFNKSTDKVAEYGLVGLMLGGLGVAKLAKIGFLAKFWKLILLGGKKIILLLVAAFAAIGAGIRKLFGLGPKDGSPPAAGGAPPPSNDPPASPPAA